MPIYEFRCKACGHRFEGIFPVTNIPTSSRCLECGLDAPRTFNAPTIHFKGHGFYNTDYKRKKHHGSKEDNSTPQETKEKVDASKSSPPDRPA